jgi:hypothetical protein
MSESFTFNGREYDYFIHPYNHTFDNERKVELPLAFDFYQRFDPSEILEFGNVLKHYGPYTHDVLDFNKDEEPTYCEDIFKFVPEKKYKATISISTIEHTLSPYFAAEKLRDIAPNSFITIPLGINVTCEMLVYRTIGYQRYYLERYDNFDWRQLPGLKVKNIHYNIGTKVRQLLILRRMERR